MKKLIILLMVMLPLGVFAQEQKIAYVDFNAVLTSLPELANVEKTLAETRETYDKELKVMQDEYTKKYEEFVSNQETMTENIKLRRTQELQDLEERVQNFMNLIYQEFQKKQEDLLQPLQEKVVKAIQDVAEENKYSYVISPQALFYQGNNAIDATPLVRRKLGI